MIKIHLHSMFSLHTEHNIKVWRNETNTALVFHKVVFFFFFTLQYRNHLSPRCFIYSFILFFIQLFKTEDITGGSHQFKYCCSTHFWSFLSDYSQNHTSRQIKLLMLGSLIGCWFILYYFFFFMFFCIIQELIYLLWCVYSNSSCWNIGSGSFMLDYCRPLLVAWLIVI